MMMGIRKPFTVLLLACITFSHIRVVVLKAAEPPVIDIRALIEQRDGLASHSSHSSAVVRDLVSAAMTWGFFHVTNHGIDEDLQAAMFEQTEVFFAAPLQVKSIVERTSNNSRGYTNKELTKNIVDMKEMYDVGGPSLHPELPDCAEENIVLDGCNQWPPEDKFALFRPVFETYMDACRNLSTVVVHALMSGLMEEDPRYILDTYFSNDSSFLRINYYPEKDRRLAEEEQCVPEHENDVEGNDGSRATAALTCSTTKTVDKAHRLGISRHTDAGGLTVLNQRVPGLEVYTGSKEDNGDGQWASVDPVPGALTINVADMLQVWSNGRLKAAEHRVRASADATERYSAAYFFNPAYDAAVAPFNSNSTAPRYDPIVWGEFRSLRFKGDFENAGREVQIENYLRPVNS